jgi:nucleolar protein 56
MVKVSKNLYKPLIALSDHMTKYIYSNCIGIFVFDDGRMIDETLFSKKEMLENQVLFDDGKELPGVKKSAEKHKDAKVFGQDETVPAEILDHFNDPKYLLKFREANLIITKRKVAESLRPDHLIIQAVNNIDEIDKVGNTLARRLREWYELYNPEFSKSIESHEKFAELIVKKSKDELLKEIGVSASESMGAEVKGEDLDAIMELAKGLDALYQMRERQVKYVEASMKKHLPNVNAIAGAMIGAKMLAFARSLKRMVLFPASTIQLLGAEKALFRHIKTGAKSPKYGVIVNHPLVARLKPKDKGRAARVLADKISIAAKIDYFKGDFKGDSLLKEVKEKLGVE